MTRRRPYGPPHVSRDWLRESARDRLFGPVPIDWLVFYRIAFGAVMVWFAAKNRDAIDYFYVHPLFHFSYDGFNWIQPLNTQVGTLRM